MNNLFLPNRESRSIWGWFRDNIAPQAVAAALLVGVTLGAVTFSIEEEKESRIPIAFSEIGKILTRHQATGQPLSPLTPYYAKTNDMVMQVFEASNAALRVNRKHKTFASELEMRIDPTFRVHKQLPEYVKEVPSLAQDALVAVSKLVAVRNATPAVVGNLSRLWDERHDDVTHTETQKTCDSKGQCTETTIEVYDYTTHHYWYNAQAGRATPTLLQDLYRAVPDINIADRIARATSTDAENEYAIEQSMREELKGKIPTDRQALLAANMWAIGSNYATFAPEARANYENLRTMAGKWGPSMRGARDRTYNSGRHEDDGPAEYQFTKRTLRYAATTQESAAKVVDGIVFTQQSAPVLESKVRAYIGVVLDGKPGDADKLRGQVMETAREIYRRNFEYGYDVQPFKWWKVLAATAFGAALGAGLVVGGYALRERLNRRRRYSNASRFG